MSISIRPVVAADWQRLREIRLRALETDPEAFTSTYAYGRALPDEEWQSRTRASEQGEQSRWFAAVGPDDQWLGIATVHGDERSRSAGLFSMWVAPEARGAGASAALCDACCAWAAEHGYDSVTLGVMADNSGAISAYGKSGFVEYDRITEPQSDRVLDLVMMRRPVA